MMSADSASEESRSRSEAHRYTGLWHAKLASIAARQTAATQAEFIVPVTLTSRDSDVPTVLPVTLLQKVNAIVEPTSPYSKEFAPWSKGLAVGVSISSFVSILASVIIFIVESLPQYHESSPSAFFAIESVCVTVFTVEFCIRCVSAPDKKSFSKDIFNAIDLTAIIPYYLALALSSRSLASFAFLRTVRLLRVLRVLKVGTISESLNSVQKSLAKSLDALYLLVLLISISTILFSSAMYLAETSNDVHRNGTWYTTTDAGAEVASQFQSIPHASWWAIVTLCTVGYGDAVPQSVAGKVVAAGTMLCGILVVAFPVILIGANFNEIFAEHQRQQSSQRKVDDLSELRVATQDALVELLKGLQGSKGTTQLLHEKRDQPGREMGAFNFNGQQRAIFAVDEPPTDVPPTVVTVSVKCFWYEPVFEVRAGSLTIVGPNGAVSNLRSSFAAPAKPRSPSFIRPASLAASAASAQLATSVGGGAHVVSFALSLDDSAAQAAAREVVSKVEPTSSDLFFASSRSVAVLDVSFPNLAAFVTFDAELMVHRFHNPSQRVRIGFLVSGCDDAESLVAILPTVTLHVAAYWKSAHEVACGTQQPDFSSTIPLHELADD
ncbi:Potassium voltage-gated channel protein Shaker [Diplonema papillatum]|nr:Potassium voltage-gated channel protein Shaker [Diplonema papillatum]